MNLLLGVMVVLAAVIGFVSNIRPFYFLSVMLFLWVFLRIVRKSKGFPGVDTGDAQ